MPRRSVRHPQPTAGVVIVSACLIAAPPLPPPVPAATQIHGARLAATDSADFPPGDGNALIVGASGLPTPPPGYIDAANALYLHLGDSAELRGVYSPESFWPLTGVENLTTDVSIAEGGQNLATQIEANVSPGSSLAVFGYSQGADVETTAMQQIYADGIPSDEVHFVMLGDPANPDGGLLSRFGVDIDGAKPTVPGLGITFSGPTPADEYPTDIYTYEYDGFADQPRYPIDFLSDLNALLGMAFNHGDYLSPDAMNSAFLLGSEGLTSYYMIPSETLPLLAPLQFIPVLGKPLYDLLEPDMSVLVNLGYGCIDNSWCDVPLPDGEPATFASYGPFPSLDFGDVLKALWSGLQQGVSDATADMGNPSYGPSIMDVPALHPLLESAYNMVDADPTGDPGAVGDLTGDQLWQGVVSQLGAGGNAFEILQGAVPGMIPDPPTTFMGIVNDVATNIENDFTTLVPITNTVTSLLTTIPGLAAGFIAQEAQGGNLLDGLGDAFAALVGLAPIGLGVGTVVPVVEALAINALNFVELFDPNALQDLAGLLTDIP
jgi:hypothetical protein